MNNGSIENASIEIEGELFGKPHCPNYIPEDLPVVFGLYRTGKSYLMNRLANERKGAVHVKLVLTDKIILVTGHCGHGKSSFINRIAASLNSSGIQQKSDHFGQRSYVVDETFCVHVVDHVVHDQLEDDFCKAELKRSQTRFVEELDTTRFLLDLLLLKIGCSKNLALTPTMTREILSQVASRGAEGYRNSKQLLRESNQAHLANYLGRKWMDLGKTLVSERKMEDKRKQVRLQTDSAFVKANTVLQDPNYDLFKLMMQQEMKVCIEWELFFTSWREQHLGFFGKYLFWPDLRKDLTGKRKSEDNRMQKITTQHVIIMTKTEAMEDSGKHNSMASVESCSGSIHDTEALLELEQMLKCKVCLDADLCTVFLPCRHMAVCERCADVLEHCPVCRATIENSIELNFE